MESLEVAVADAGFVAVAVEVVAVAADDDDDDAAADGHGLASILLVHFGVSRLERSYLPELALDEKQLH